MSEVLVIDAFEAEFTAAAAVLPGIRLRYEPLADRTAVLRALATAEVLVLKSKIRVDAEALAAAPQLRCIVRAGVGLEHIDLAAAAARGIAVLATPGANTLPVGEQALGMLLGLMHHIARADRQVRAGLWLREENRGTELSGRTVGIVGYGNTGQAFARCLAGFGCQVLAYDKYRSAYGDAYARESDWAEMEATADVLSLHVPLTAETHHLLDADRIARFARPFWLLNLARGSVVDEQAVLAALAAGHIRGAALDVLPEEPPRSAEAQALLAALAAQDNVLLTPHIGGWTVESAARTNAAVLAHLRDWLRQRT